MWTFIKKEFFHIFRDYRSMVVLFGIPLIQVLLFGFAITNDVNNAKIALLDHSKDPVTREITHKLLSSHYFLLSRYLNSEDEIKPAFKKGEIKEVVVFEPHFAQKLETEGKARIQLIIDATNPNTASILNGYTTGIINSYTLDKMKKEHRLPAEVNVQTAMMYNPELKSAFMFVPGIMTVILMLVSAMMTSISITKEKELGTMEALLVSPVKPSVIILGKVTPYVVLSSIIFAIIVLLSRFVFGMPIEGSIGLLVAESLLFLVMALSLGILISTVSKSQQQAMLLSMFVLMMPTILLSGFIFPIENMPLVLQYLSDIMPGKWFIIIIKNIMLKGNGFLYIWKETLIIFSMTLFFLMVSIKKFNVRLE
ncbi:MAG: ABC transporter permease [Bacteroidales bacterium]|nr:ABC transporter permease [Bacteroidales bacterium]